MTDHDPAPRFADAAPDDRPEDLMTLEEAVTRYYPNGR